MDIKKTPRVKTRQRISSGFFLRQKNPAKKKGKKILCKKRPLLSTKAIPKIDPKSRRLAAKSQPDLIITESRSKRTYEILKRSSIMPKLVHLNLNDLRSSRTVNPSPLILKFDQSFTTPKVQTPVSFPSVSCMTDRSPKDPLLYLPEEISRRNQLILDLKSQNSGNLTPVKGLFNLPFEQRSKIWQKNRKEKLVKMREEKKVKKDENCTFYPMTNSGSKRTTPRSTSIRSMSGYSHKRTASHITSHSGKTSVLSNFSQNEDASLIYRQFNINSSSPMSINNICPVPLNVSYHSGFSYELQVKSKPMIRYQDL